MNMFAVQTQSQQTAASTEITEADRIQARARVSDEHAYAHQLNQRKEVKEKAGVLTETWSAASFKAVMWESGFESECRSQV